MLQEVDNALLGRIQRYVSNDINRRLSSDTPEVLPEQVNVFGFTRIFGHWKAYAAPDETYDLYYEISHDEELATTVVNVYAKLATIEAVV